MCVHVYACVCMCVCVYMFVSVRAGMDLGFLLKRPNFEFSEKTHEIKGNLCACVFVPCVCVRVCSLGVLLGTPFAP